MSPEAIEQRCSVFGGEGLHDGLDTQLGIGKDAIRNPYHRTEEELLARSARLVVAGKPTGAQLNAAYDLKARLAQPSNRTGDPYGSYVEAVEAARVHSNEVSGAWYDEQMSGVQAEIEQMLGYTRPAELISGRTETIAHLGGAATGAEQLVLAKV